MSFYIALVSPTGVTAQLSSASSSPMLEAVAKRAQHDAETGTSLSVSDFRSLFEAELSKSRVSVREAFEHYEATYSAVRANRPWWQSVKDLVPNLGWLVGAIALLYAVFKTQIETALKNFVDWVVQAVYGHVAGYRIFWWTGLRRYRRSLEKKYQNVEITFRPDRPLEMHKVYVPLKLTHGSPEEIDAQQTIANNNRVIVLGPPGSGKSMLMRRLALDYGLNSRASLPDCPVPIVLELNRVGGSDRSLEEHLAEVLAINEFPNATRFVNEHLKRGTLMLLLDGLDEVNSSQRAEVVRKIKDLIDLYKDCRVLITCRTAVYDDEFAAYADVTVSVLEFSDHQMQGFLFAWESDFQKSDKSVEQLVRTLQERPRILEVARNPLMLTMIAFLYTDPKFVLPHSRAEFYKIAVQELIDLHSHLRLTEFKASQKRLVLQHLALLFQDRGDLRHEDRRSVPVKEVIQATSEVLPQLNVEQTRAQALLDEIVTRSGLLLSIDGGLRYQFAHLSLQEFFAAEEITQDDELLVKFQANPNGWRESVKLWCGLDHDCTDVVREVFASDELLAFEMLADAQRVDEELSSTITHSFVEQLGKLPETRDRILRAFGAVAADARPRGKRVFDALEQAMSSPERQVVRDGAEALSFTNTTQAAETLVKFRSIPEVRSSLLRMGDLAVQHLAAAAERGEHEAIEDLISVGTPKAVLALAPLLWHDGEQTARRVAAALATVTNHPPSERALRSFTMTSGHQNADALKWVWKPFSEPPDSALPIVMGRISSLLSQAMDTEGVPRGIDRRLIVPLILLGLRPSLFDLGFEYPRDATRADWETLFEPADYVFHTEWHFKAASVMQLALFVFVGALLAKSLFSALEVASGMTPVASALIVYIGALMVWINIPYRGAGQSTGSPSSYTGRVTVPQARWMIVLSVIPVISLSLLYCSSVMSFTTWTVGLGTGVAVAVRASVLVSVGARRDRAARNPLHGILEKLPRTSPSGTPDRVHSEAN